MPSIAFADQPPVRCSFEFDTQTVRDSINECEVGCDLADIEDSAVVESSLAKRFDIRFANTGRSAREALDVIEHRFVGVANRGRSIICGDRRHQRLVLGQLTKRGTMVVQSVVALIDGRHDHGDHFALRSR